MRFKARSERDISLTWWFLPILLAGSQELSAFERDHQWISSTHDNSVKQHHNHNHNHNHNVNYAYRNSCGRGCSMLLSDHDMN